MVLPRDHKKIHLRRISITGRMTKSPRIIQGELTSSYFSAYAEQRETYNHYADNHWGVAQWKLSDEFMAQKNAASGSKVRPCPCTSPSSHCRCGPPSCPPPGAPSPR